MGRDNQMNIGLFTICYAGYGRFAKQWCMAIANSMVMPTKATLALFGQDHGLTDDMARECLDILPCLDIIYCGRHTNIGTDRNKAIESTDTEWIMLVSIDDEILPNALEEIEKLAKPDIDVVAVSYTEEGLGGSTRIVSPPETIVNENLFKWRTNWIAPYSPFRRSLWEKTPYIDGEFPNAPMVFNFVRSGARFARTDAACVKYIKREGSHSTRRAVGETRAIEDLIDSLAQPELGNVHPASLRLERLEKITEEKIVIDIYQSRYLKHQEEKKNRVAVDLKLEYTDAEIMSLFKIMHERRSQRIFNGEEIDKDRLAGVLKAASLSPSSCNRKAVSIKIISSEQNKSLVERMLVGGAGWINGASAILLLLADMAAYKSPAEIPYMPYLDTGFIAENVYLAGEALGVGVCFVNPNVREENQAEFNSLFVTPGHKFCGALALGSYDLREAKKEYEVNEVLGE